MEKTEIISDKATFSKFAASSQVSFLWGTVRLSRVQRGETPSCCRLGGYPDDGMFTRLVCGVGAEGRRALVRVLTLLLWPWSANSTALTHMKRGRAYAHTCMCSAGDGPQSLTHTKLALYYWVPPSALFRQGLMLPRLALSGWNDWSPWFYTTLLFEMATVLYVASILPLKNIIQSKLMIWFLLDLTTKTRMALISQEIHLSVPPKCWG